MARYGNSKTVRKTPEVTFSLELRAANIEQIEAGKRLFSKLLAKVQLSINLSEESKRIDTKT